MHTHELRRISFFTLLNEVERNARFRIELAKQTYLMRLVFFVKRAQHQDVTARCDEDIQFLCTTSFGIGDDRIKI